MDGNGRVQWAKLAARLVVSRIVKCSRQAARVMVLSWMTTAAAGAAGGGSGACVGGGGGGVGGIKGQS